MSTARHLRPAAPPAEGGPSLADRIDAEARQLRARGDELARFLADELVRIAGKARFFRAATPLEYLDREEVAEESLREHWYDLGREHERAEASDRRTYGPGAPPVPIDARPIAGTTSGLHDPER